MSRLMGIDFGGRRIGVALSDEAGDFSFPHSVIVNDKDTIKKIKKICAENDVGKIILGESVDYAGRPNTIMAKIIEFKKNIEKEIGLTVIYQKEMLTTQEAERLQGKHDKIDASAAALILRSFIEKHNVL